MKVLATIFLSLSFLPGVAQNPIVTEVEFEGIKRMRLSFVKKKIGVRSGIMLDTVFLANDVERLTRFSGIANATYRVEGLGDDNYKVVFSIDEQFTLIPVLNIWTSNDLLAFKIGLYENNLFGKNISVGGFYQHSVYSSYGLSFKSPYLFSKQFGLEINYQDWSSIEPVYFNNFVADYKYKNKSIEVLGLYEINFKNVVQAGANRFSENYHYISGTDSLGVSEIPLDVSQEKYMIKLAYDYNNLKYKYYQVSGIQNILNLQDVVTLDGFSDDFLIGWNDFMFFILTGSKGNFASRIRLGLSTNNDSPLAPFTVDNHINIRGVGDKIARGTGSIVWNVEYRYTVFEKKWFVLQANAFVDAGSWRNPGGKLNDFTSSQNIRVYPGLGLRFIHKKVYNAIFRIDYGYGITRNASQGIVFGLGQFF